MHHINFHTISNQNPNGFSNCTVTVFYELQGSMKFWSILPRIKQCEQFYDSIRFYRLHYIKVLNFIAFQFSGIKIFILKIKRLSYLSRGGVRKRSAYFVGSFFFSPRLISLCYTDIWSECFINFVPVFHKILYEQLFGFIIHMRSLFFLPQLQTISTVRGASYSAEVAK